MPILREVVTFYLASILKFTTCLHLLAIYGVSFAPWDEHLEGLALSI
jgi:hypothetical protein